jgi:N-methylhydantoinase A
MSFKIGIDVGGTFTDLFVWSSDGAVHTHKTLSTPEDSSVGVLNGLRAIAAHHGLEVEDLARQITTIVHGTTVTTNATLTRTGAKTALLTTEGVRDALEMRRGIREEQYNNRLQNVVPLVPRHARIPVRGRLDYKGNEIERLDVTSVREAARSFKEDGFEAVAICFMNAFANPDHEEAAAEIVKAEFGDAYLSVSSDVLPIVRFYNRVSTTTVNAYVGPTLRDYLESLTAKLAAIGFDGVLLIMQSSGGVALPEVIGKRPALTLLSGPAGGPRAAVAATRPHGHDNCIVVDMGGTSFDASLVREGDTATNTEGEIDRLRIAFPMLAIHTIGAGGGSIGRIDAGGLLRMGPESAGASPGPACYGLGGTRATCTDANLVLGYLDPEYFAGGQIRLDYRRAHEAVAEHIAKPLGVDVEEAAAGMYRVINTNMAHGVREITIERGLDPREYPMVVAGGAGAIHGCMIAHELDIATLLVPSAASVLCATGMLLCDLQHDFVRSYVCRFGDLDIDRLKSLVSEMVTQGREQLQNEDVPDDRTNLQIALDLRYVKQYHEVTVAVPSQAIEREDFGHIADAFHREHNRLYGYDLSDEGTDLELINVRVRAVGCTDTPELPTVRTGDEDPSHAEKGLRPAYLPESDTFAEIPVYDGHALEARNVICGPGLIERTDTTIFVSESYQTVVDEHGGYYITRREDK